MFLFKKAFWILGLIFLISLGGVGTQSNSLFAQGMGFIGLLTALIILYIFGRMIWKALGCLPSFFILSSITLFLMFAVGIFNNGFGNALNSMVQFLGYNRNEVTENDEQEQTNKQKFSENFSQNDSDESEDKNNEDFESTEDTDSSEVSPDLFMAEKNTISPQKQNKSEHKKNILDSVMGTFVSKTPLRQQENTFDPNVYPVIYGSVTVITGDTLEMYGKYFRLFGIEAPESNQTCADKQGRAYNCGYEATAWLKSWIDDAELECRIIQQDTKGNMIGICSYGPYDIGAALVNAGWAVPLPKYAHIYGPYELQAQQAQRGLWQGEFYKPWDWRKLQSRKPKIKIIRPKKRLMGIFG